MRVELRNLQRELGLMFIHVTHNQEESLSMADRIVVMNDAKIQQIGDPLTIATKPETELVARFMGDNNIIQGTVARREGDRLVVDDGSRPGQRASPRTTTAAWATTITVAVRAAAVRLDSTAAAVGAEHGRLRDRLRRVPRRSREAPPHGRAASACSRRCRASSTHPCAGARASRSASPGRRRMSSSSGPEHPPQLRRRGDRRGRGDRAAVAKERARREAASRAPAG